MSCHYCALTIHDYDILKLLFDDKEKTLHDLKISTKRPYSADCPEDCPDYDCSENYPDYDYDCDCSDCPVDCDCSDCPDDCDCSDCPDDCSNF